MSWLHQFLKMQVKIRCFKLAGNIETKRQQQVHRQVALCADKQADDRQLDRLADRLTTG